MSRLRISTMTRPPFLRNLLIIGCLVSLIPVFYLLMQLESKSSIDSRKSGDYHMYARWSANATAPIPQSVIRMDKHLFSKVAFRGQHVYSANLSSFEIMHAIDELHLEDRRENNWLQMYLQKYGNKYFQNILSDSLTSKKKPPRKLKIIAVLHSHNDPGWLKTLERYYKLETSYILSNMLKKLQEYPTMTFVWAEVVYFSMWWEDLPISDRAIVKSLITRKQLEFVSGGWVVPDEACTHFYSIIDQLIEGHEWLLRELGVKPRISWSLDVFGYSANLAYLYKLANFSDMVILRVHTDVKDFLQHHQLLDFMWRQLWDTSGRMDMHVSMLPYRLYSIKHQCGPGESVCARYDFRRVYGEAKEAKVDFVDDKNVHELAQRLYNQLKMKNDLYRHNVVLFPIGDDFRYNFESEWDNQYLNFKAMFDYMNGREDWNVEAKFGTVSEYMELVQAELKADKSLQIPSLQGDFFPYMDIDDNYWTGFYTTRPFLKKQGQILSVNLRCAELLHTIATGHAFQEKIPTAFEATNIDNLTLARRALALFQHHDAVTGTSRSYVAVDYLHRLTFGLSAVKSVIERSLQFLLTSEKRQAAQFDLKLLPPPGLYHLHLGHYLVNSSQSVTVFNPLPHRHSRVVRLTIMTSHVEVRDASGSPVLSQINPVWVKNESTMQTGVYELVFLVDLPALGSKTYTITELGGNTKTDFTFHAMLGFSNCQVPPAARTSHFVLMSPRGESFTFDNAYLRVRFSVHTGMLQSVTTKFPIQTSRVGIKFQMYKSRHSGPYVFYPTGPAIDGVMLDLPPLQVVHGPVLSELRVVQHNSVVTHRITLYNTTSSLGHVLEINNIANMSAYDDKELIMSLITDIQSKSVFYTDANSLHAIKRQRFRNILIAANYYPMTSYAFIEDADTRLTLLSAQPLGVSSQDDGSLEVMLDRRPIYDDNKGLGDSITDNKPTASQFYLLVEKRFANTTLSTDLRSQLLKPVSGGASNTSTTSLYSFLTPTASYLQQNLYHHALVFTMHSLSNAHIPLLTDREFIMHPFPCHLQLVSLRSLNAGQKSAALILHSSQWDSSYHSPVKDCTGSLPILSALFKDLRVAAATEMSLTLLDEKDNIDVYKELVLWPMDIRTYRLRLGQ